MCPFTLRTGQAKKDKVGKRASRPSGRCWSGNRHFSNSREMERGAKEARLKRIRIYDIRHSAISLLMDMDSMSTWPTSMTVVAATSQNDSTPTHTEAQ